MLIILLQPISASTNIRTYLLRQNKKLVQCLYTPLRNEGIEKLHELCTEEEIERDRERLKRIRMVTVNFPVEMIEIAGTYDENVNRDSMGLSHILMRNGNWKEIDKITTKELQWTLKSALGKIESQDFCRKLGIDSFDKEDIMKFRSQCKNVKLRHIFFRLISKDFFAKDRMYKRRMVMDNICSRCGGVETYSHLIWECTEARRIWRVYNEYMDSIGQSGVKVEIYEDVFKIENIGAISTIKMKIVQEMIQIERPTGWTVERIKDTANALKNTELYNASIVKKLDKVRIKWSMIR
jgi:zinc-binding in reverse transcriptase